MRIFVLENCVVQGSVWFGGEEVFVDEAVGREMVERGVGKEMAEPDPLVHGRVPLPGMVEKAVGRRERT